MGKSTYILSKDRCNSGTKDVPNKQKKQCVCMRGVYMSEAAHAAVNTDLSVGSRKAVSAHI